MSNYVEFTSATTNPTFPSVKDVNPDEVLEKKEQVKLVDVRRPDEYVGEYGHVAGAELLTLNDLPEKITQLSKDETIVFICRSGGRSAQAANFALENGFTSVYNMQGGMILWTEKNYKAEDKSEE